MSEKLEYLSFKIRRLATRIYDPYKNTTMYGEPVLDINRGGNAIEQLLASDKPCLVGRIGCSEILAVHSALEMNYGIRKSIERQAGELVCTNAGFFPKNDEMICRFADINIEAMRVCDYLGHLKHHHVDWLIHKYSPKTLEIGVLRSLEPYYHETPWTSILKGKKVLVVHPFEKTIRSQYEKRNKIWMIPDILPEFELKTVKAVQSVGDNTGGFSDWFAALDFMKERIAAADFDIAILGCGAYAFPLAAYIKTELKKKSVVLGGATQILFGIKGSRWTNHPVISKFFNEYWVNPSQDEVPEGFKKIENGCYW